MNQISKLTVRRSLLRRNPFTRCASKPISSSLVLNNPISSSNRIGIAVHISKLHPTFTNPPRIHVRKYNAEAAAVCNSDDDSSCSEGGSSESESETQSDTSPTAQDNTYQMSETPLHIACAENKVDTVKTLLSKQGSEKVDLEARNMYGETPLHMAAKNGSSEAVRVLLDHGALVESKANYGETPLHLAAKNGSSEAARVLLDHGALLESKDNYGETPLHMAAKSGSSEAARVLLDHGALVDSRATYGETPLHMASKSGSSEAARLLLDHGALVESKANNGMTPLHLSVLYSLRSKDCSTVKTLLEYNADCSAKDKVISVLGLVSLLVTFWCDLGAKGMLLDEKRRALGLKVADRRSPHMAFLGNPGTGKTKVARILGRLLHMIGTLPTDKVTEVQRTDLVGQYIGHTGPKTKKKIKEAEGGILFVDEAYRLMPEESPKDFGIEALEEIMSVMDTGKIVVIFAGYSEPMKRVIAANDGFSRRVTKFFSFDDFNSEEIAQIVHLKMNNQEETSLLHGFKLDTSCTVETVAKLIEKETTEKQRNQMNGGLADTMLVNARENLDLRLDYECANEDDLVTITLEDLEAGLKSLTQ